MIEESPSIWRLCTVQPRRKEQYPDLSIREPRAASPKHQRHVQVSLARQVYKPTQLRLHMQKPIRHRLAQEILCRVHHIKRTVLEAGAVEVDGLGFYHPINPFANGPAGVSRTMTDIIPILQTQVVEDPDSVAVKVDAARVVVDLGRFFQDDGLLQH